MVESREILSHSFYARHPLEVARDLLGQRLVHEDVTGRCAGIIVETEAYHGFQDPASHAYRGQTKRNAVMFGPPGYAYVYKIYGIYSCLNAVCGSMDEPAAVLIRALEPTEGLAQMMLRRNRSSYRHARELTSGPGRLCLALDITVTHNGVDLEHGSIRIERAWQGNYQMVERGMPLTSLNTATLSIRSGPRIGITQGLDLPWRFWIAGNPYVSPPR